jgi:hypothetical protein
MAKKEQRIILVEQNEGEKIPYEISGNRITFGDDELTINIERHERDDANHIDICRDRFGNLVTGVIPGLAENYAAQIQIPARGYNEVEDGEDEETGEPKIIPVPIPFDLKKCTLTLWALV